MTNANACCFDSLFTGCLITDASELLLPATTLAARCYCSMFEGCTSLTAAPMLHASTLAEYCYCRMFKGYTNLPSVTMLATDVSAADCLLNWLSGAGTSVSGTKYVHVTSDAMTTNSTIVSNSPGWSIVYP